MLDVTNVDDNAQYRVHLKSKLTIFGMDLWPGTEVTMRGDTLKAHTAQIASFEVVPVEPLPIISGF